MTDEPTTTQRQKKPTFQSWSPDDSKLLVITVAATVIANVVTVLFIGAAIALAHSFRPTRPTSWPYFILLAMTAMATISVYMVVYSLRRSGSKRDAYPGERAVKFALITVGLFSACLGLIFALVWIGWRQELSEVDDDAVAEGGP